MRINDFYPLESRFGSAAVENLQAAVSVLTDEEFDETDMEYCFSIIRLTLDHMEMQLIRSKHANVLHAADCDCLECKKKWAKHDNI